MFLNQEDWSEDEIDDVDAVVPISNLPTPQVLSAPGPGDGEGRASAYNERMARARLVRGTCPRGWPCWSTAR